MRVGRLVVCSASKSISSGAGTTRTGEELGHKATAAKKHSVKEVLVKSKSGLGEHPAQLIKHGLIGEYVSENILLRILETSISGIIANASPSGKVVLLPFAVISQHAIGLIYCLKLLLSLLLIAGIGIRVVFEGKLSKGFLNIFLTGIIRDAKNLVVIFHNLTI